MKKKKKKEEGEEKDKEPNVGEKRTAEGLAVSGKS